MTKDENIHKGHRERLVEKFLQNPNSFKEHELLELLLFSFLPRIDTNVIAHRLMRSFGTLEKLFSATAEDIMSVDGIGKTTASKIVLIGQIQKAVFSNREQISKKPYKRLVDYESDIIDCFKYSKTEKIVIFLLNKQTIPITMLTFEGEGIDSVSAKTEDILHAFAIHKPVNIILAHNHPSESLLPSINDDLATAKLFVLCQLHGIILHDHLVVAGNRAFSYRCEGKLDEYYKIYKLEEFLKGKEELLREKEEAQNSSEELPNKSEE